MNADERKRRHELRLHLPWLYRELPVLTQAGIVDAATETRLREYYGRPELGMGRRQQLMVLLAVLGALLIGSGMVMIIAHNWDQLPVTIKLGMAFLPLLIGQGLGFYVLLTDKGTAWREGIALFIALATAAAISLVAQTYQISGDFPRFLLTWTLLTLPLAYLLGSTVAAVFYLILLTWWTGAAMDLRHGIWLFWPLAFAYVPFLWYQWKQKGIGSGAVVWQKWTIAAVAIFLPGFMSRYLGFDVRLSYLLVFAVLYLYGRLGGEEEENFWLQPFCHIGQVGLLVMAVIFCHREGWHSWGRSWVVKTDTWSVLSSHIGAWLFVILWLIGIVLTCLKKRFFLLWWGLLPLLPLLAMFGKSFDRKAGAMYGCVVLFVIGLATLVSGYRSDRWMRMNGGMLAAVIPILFRFFADDFSFIVKGMAFMVIGGAMLSVNWLFARNRTKRGGAVEEVAHE